MERILYLINSKEYNYHKRMAEDFCAIIPGNILDMSDGKAPAERYYEIEEMHPEVIITFDLAGYELRTGNDTLSLNNIYARYAHILFHRSERYGNDLKCRQNLSMFTFVTEGEDINAFRERFPEIPNVCEFVDVSYKADNEYERADNRNKIRSWWEGFKEEAML
ncbi:MAG: hypothetical protein J5910_02690 [Lachnospiraceae bacterium]|nr:hypothetical protein [Lachnospiraceae bacterium]